MQDQYSFCGSRKSLEELVGEYTSPLYNFVFQFVHDRQVSEDIVQETWIKVWKHQSSFDQKKKFKTWIFTIAKNTTFDYLKKKKSIPFSFFQNEEGENTLEAVDRDTPLPDEVLDEAQMIMDLERVLEKIPELYRAILVLAYKEDFSLGEIATILNVPYNTIKSRHQRAIKLLKQAFSKEVHLKGKEGRINS